MKPAKAAAIGAFVTALHAAHAAHGARPPREIAIQLGDPGSIAPSHVCVVSNFNAKLSDEETRFARTETKPGETTPTPVNDLSKGLSLELSLPADKPTVRPVEWTGDDLIQHLVPLKAPDANSCGVWRRSSQASVAWSASTGDCSRKTRSEGACSFRIDPNVLGANEKLSCRHNSQSSLARGTLNVPVLHFPDARVLEVRLDGHVARIVIDVAATAKNATLAVKVVGGDYLDSTALPLQELRGAEIVTIPLLLRRCSEEKIVIPNYECPSPIPDEHVTLTTRDHSIEVPRQAATGEMVLDIPNHVSGQNDIDLFACRSVDGKSYAHRFQATWNATVHSEQHRLSARRIEFAWERSGLVREDECPRKVQLAESGHPCTPIDHPDAGMAAVASGACWYHCDGNISLPVTTRFERPPTRCASSDIGGAGSASERDDQWEIRLSRAGQKLRGFVASRDRDLSLCWKGWGKLPDGPGVPEEASWWGDRIRYVRLGTADGRSYLVRPGATHVRIAGIEKGDPFTVAFDGERSFHIVPGNIAPGGILEIEHPRGNRADHLVFSLTVTGGLRHLGKAAGSTAWNPYGEVNILGTVRALRWRSRDFYVDPELRTGAIFTTNAYFSTFPTASVEDEAHWENVPVLMFPLEAWLHGFGNQPLHFGIGGGVVLSREMFASDSSRVSNPPKPSFGVNFGVGIARSFAIDFEARHVWSNEMLGRAFDEGGVHEATIVTAGIWFLGARFRFDDIFEGALKPSDPKPPTDDQKAAKKKQANSPGASQITVSQEGR